MNLDELERFGIIPVVVLDRAEQAGPVADALVRGGLPLAEVCFRTPVAAAAIAAMAARGDILVGAGTVLTPDQVDRAADAGARFIVSPGLDEAVLARAEARGLPALPGVVTPTEVMRARALGYSLVKFFPAKVNGGPAAIAAMASALRDIRFVPTGGVGPDTMADYLRLPSVVAVGGSWMVPTGLVQAGAYDVIVDLVRRAVSDVEALRSLA